MLEVRRNDPGLRTGAAPAETRGGADTAVFTINLAAEPQACSPLL
jgi:hypothetical protein